MRIFSWCVFPAGRFVHANRPSLCGFEWSISAVRVADFLDDWWCNVFRWHRDDQFQQNVHPMHARRHRGQYVMKTFRCRCGATCERPIYPVHCRCGEVYHNRGLGDRLARFLNRFWLLRVFKKRFPQCGCSSRQETLNAWFPSDDQSGL